MIIPSNDQTFSPVYLEFFFPVLAVRLTNTVVTELDLITPMSNTGVILKPFFNGSARNHVNITLSWPIVSPKASITALLTNGYLKVERPTQLTTAPMEFQHLASQHRWFCGPDFCVFLVILGPHLLNLVNRRPTIQECLHLYLTNFIQATTAHPIVKLIQHSSDYQKLKLTVAWLLRYNTNHQVYSN